MIQNPILKVLSTFQNSNARNLLMGGQACVLYGGAEFSRDVDFVVAIDSENIAVLQMVLGSLAAEPIFVPPLDPQALEKGHACHFRCRNQEVEGVRIDLMNRMRGCPDFEELWRERSIVAIPEVGEIGLLSLPHLVRAKKTQRNKDWPMVRRLLEADILNHSSDPTDRQIRFWLLECRTPELLMDLAKRFSKTVRSLSEKRRALVFATEGAIEELRKELQREEELEKEADRMYWDPLKQELAEMKRSSREDVP
ncbi:MAG: hypothetical protein KC940_19480 [Candidatus Omnitrophica bacterium]|nr:hypothetical protein [Candidatus Omnitrophota bacterium]MCA9426130.1 hypothetical protein [Candidatus Omnitrophota bacterium]MCA9432705.1 hypothetical protein [Candidatus Omnitrophota bacterium]MCA9443400.1 hypothetical protein [Candidatus Omnitrophota bacterium]